MKYTASLADALPGTKIAGYAVYSCTTTTDVAPNESEAV